MKKNKTLLYYVITLVVGLVISIPLAYYRGLGTAENTAYACRYLSDGLFVAGVLLTGLGMMVWISTTGFFDIFSYAFKSLFVLFSPLKKAKEFPHYYEYKCEKDAKREGKPISHTVLVVGLICLAASLICLALYYSLMPVL